MNTLNLGIIGMSPGNGHPYSWSAIFNGYSHEHMEHCGFPVIPRYLELQTFPEDTIKEAKVTHIWTQDNNISSKIARTTFIDKIVNRYIDMIGEIDGVLLARDDSENHIEMALPFLEAGLPIYIDKPLALSVKEAEKLISSQHYPGQLFSCSALHYAEELKLTKTDCSSLGRIRQIHAIVPKDWDKYAIHVIEPVLLLIPERGAILETKNWNSTDSTTLVVKYENNIQVLVTTLGTASSPISIRVFGEKNWKDLLFHNTFPAFKKALNEFTQSIIHQDVRIESDFIIEVISLIEAGRTS